MGGLNFLGPKGPLGKAIFGDGNDNAPQPQRLVTQAERDKQLGDIDAQIAAEPADLKKQLLRQIRQQVSDSLLVPPPPAPDASDALVQQARTAARRRLLSGGGLTGPLDLTPVDTQKPGLVGY